VLAEARDAGRAAREALAARAAAERGIPAGTALHYLAEQMHYGFGRAEREGLAHFYALAVEEGLAPAGGRLRLAPAGR
jgi:predicted solute-binding protein